MRKLRRKIMMSGVIASTLGVALTGAISAIVVAAVKNNKKKQRELSETDIEADARYDAAK